MARLGADEVVFQGPGVHVLGKDVPFKSLFVLPDNDETVIHVSSSDELAALVCASGRVYTFGHTDHHSWMKEDEFNHPTLVPGLESVKIVQAACGNNFTFFLSDKGKLYSCGGNECGQLGQGTTVDNPTPTLVKDLPRIKKVCTGFEHTVVLTDACEVYVCGNDSNSEIVLRDTKTQKSFTKLSHLDLTKIDIACGYYHTALLTSGEYMLICGWNNHGQISTQKEYKVSKFVSVPSISNIACGSYHTVALATDNTVWGWGRNNYGQLGNGTTSEQFTPTRVMGLEGHVISKVIAGNCNTAFFTDEGSVFVCGHFFGEVISVPYLLKMIEGLKVSQVAFGLLYSVILVDGATKLNVPAKTVDSKDQNEVQSPSAVTDSERLTLEFLECPVCLKLMGSPIRMCVNGHNFCDPCFFGLPSRICPTCQVPLAQWGRNIVLERFATDTELPCLDCLVRLPVPKLLDHPDACAKRQYKCPLDQACNWSGLRGTLLSHATSEHSDLIHKDLPYTFSQTVSEELLTTELLLLHDELFTLHRKYDSDVNEAQIAVRHIGPPDEAKKFKCRLEWNADSFEWVSLVLLNISSYKSHSLDEIFHPENCASLKKNEIQEIIVETALELPCKIIILKQ